MSEGAVSGIAAPRGDRVVIFDTTLRDGEQAPGCTMTREEKLAVARQLASVLASPPEDFPPISASSVHYRLGNIYERQGKPDRARAAYAEALRLNPKNEDARKSLAALK